MRSRLVSLASTVLACLVLLGRPAHALDTCSLPSVAEVVFGTYDPISGGAVDSTGTITYHCTGTPETIAISIDAGGAGSFTPRRMRSGLYELAYNLYREASRSSIWGDGTGASATFQETAAVGANTVITIFARIFGGQNPHVGSYDDSLVVTISF